MKIFGKPPISMQVHFEPGEVPFKWSELRGYEDLGRKQYSLASFCLTSAIVIEPRIAPRVVDTCASQGAAQMARRFNHDLLAFAQQRPELYREIEIFRAEIDNILLWAKRTTIRNEQRTSIYQDNQERHKIAVEETEKIIKKHYLLACQDDPVKCSSYVEVLAKQKLLSLEAMKIIQKVKKEHKGA